LLFYVNCIYVNDSIN